MLNDIAPDRLTDDLAEFIAPGQPDQPGKSTGLIPVATGPYGESIGISFTAVTGHTAGPRICVMAGVHGDEYDGMDSVRRLIREIDPAELSGSVLAIPCLNLAAFAAGSRTSGIDKLNLNRTFPGAATGSITERLAHTFNTVVVQHVDAVIDIHTGGEFGDITPLTVVQKGAEDLVAGMGKAACNPVLWRGGAWGGTSRQSVIQEGKPAVTLEAGGGMYRPDVVDHHYQSATNMLRYFGALSGTVRSAPAYTWVNGTFIRANHGGFAHPHKLAGQRCVAGEKLISVVDENGRERDSFDAPSDGIVLWNRVRRSVQPGDEIVIYGEVDDSVE